MAVVPQKLVVPQKVLEQGLESWEAYGNTF